jgi:hypothetical protein
MAILDGVTDPIPKCRYVENLWNCDLLYWDSQIQYYNLCGIVMVVLYLGTVVTNIGVFTGTWPGLR